MQISWLSRQSWVAVFDVLGFGRLLEQADHDLSRAILTSQLDDLLNSLRSETVKGKLEWLIFSDTIAIFTPTEEPKDYPWFLLQCKNLIKQSIAIRLPLRGAISIGRSFSANEHPIVLGRPFSEAFQYCEDQDWIGLLLTPSATRALRSVGLEPLHHHFVDGPIPLRRMAPDDVLAYRFQDGATNFQNPLVPQLQNMQHSAPAEAKPKYARTIEHIQRYHRWVAG
ncbi:MAG: hypothetical protein OEV27_16695 [Nitrospira sp.]|nr:hypothetical protein [Nitrospira sp.]MDH4344631.1 hypothetical protein [Nitrospira sp.]MDH5336334.1 hypothetical protein [Nitrospira sp.]